MTSLFIAVETGSEAWGKTPLAFSNIDAGSRIWSYAFVWYQNQDLVHIFAKFSMPFHILFLNLTGPQSWCQASGPCKKSGFTQIPETISAPEGPHAFPVFVPPKARVVARYLEQTQRTSRPLCLALTLSLRPWAPLQGGVPVCRAKEFWVISRQKGGRHEDCCGFVREGVGE